jgi:hypothetical protein
LTPTSPPDGAGGTGRPAARLTGRPHIERGPDPDGRDGLGELIRVAEVDREEPR